MRLNFENDYFRSNPINTDLIETAALAHDLGHPPFGHNGEEALDDCMKSEGGFEGNAQTLRILSKLEKRQTKGGEEIARPVVDGEDNRAGLNLTFRTLAAVLKYDSEIPARRKTSDHIEKGYYYTEKDLVRQIKEAIGCKSVKRLRTIECSIMDIADDIAYSTYDIEDAFKAGFMSPVSMLSVNQRLATRVGNEVSKRLQKAYPTLSKRDTEFPPSKVYEILTDVFREVCDEGISTLQEYTKSNWDDDLTVAYIASSASEASTRMAASGYYRSRMTSEYVGRYIRSVKLDFNAKQPMLSSVYLEQKTFEQLEVLKNFAFQALIMSPMLKVAEYRGKDIVKAVFKAISDDDGYLLMPSDFQDLYMELKHPAEKKRVICDFIAGMTDRYAVQFYGRLFGTNPETIFSPL